MSDDVAHVKTAFEALLKNISKPRRRLLYQQIGRELARSQRRRIKAQQNPDGTPYAPRKAKHKTKGRIASKLMFKKIGLPAHLKLRYENEGISLGFYGGDAAIAEIHQYGLKGRVRPEFNWKVPYERRELLGFSEEDAEMIEKFVLKALAEGVE